MGGISMSKKGSRHRKHSQEFKVQIVERNLYDGISVNDLATQYQLDPRMIRRWRSRYLEQGIDGLKPKAKGRPKGTSGIGRSKTRFDSELERLTYENVQLKLEILRLKKLHAFLRGDATFR
jgi:transposase